jgi:hypothetical protein
MNWIHDQIRIQTWCHFYGTLLLRPINGNHGQVEGEEVAPGEEAREHVQAAHVDAAVQGTVLLRPTTGYHGQVERK